jgi:hypothetical protein
VPAAVCNKNSGVSVRQSAATHITDTAADVGKEGITDNTVRAYAFLDTCVLSDKE